MCRTPPHQKKKKNSPVSNLNCFVSMKIQLEELQIYYAMGEH